MAEAGKTEEKVFVKKYRKPAKKKVCAFCVAGEKTIDYKDVAKIKNISPKKAKYCQEDKLVFAHIIKENFAQQSSVLEI